MKILQHSKARKKVPRKGTHSTRNKIKALPVLSPFKQIILKTW